MPRFTAPALGFILTALLFAAPPAIASVGETSTANTSETAEDPWSLCMDAVADAENEHNIPRHLMAAIAVAESGRWNRERREKSAWPWTVMAEGKGRYLPTKAEAIATVRDLKARNVRNIDVGCMQINLRYHPAAFNNLDQAFDPVANVAYGSTFLKSLFEETGSWQKASGRYHSATPEHNRPYRMRILKLWNEQTRLAHAARRADQKRQTAARRAARSTAAANMAPIEQRFARHPARSVPSGLRRPPRPQGAGIRGAAYPPLRTVRYGGAAASVEPGTTRRARTAFGD